MMRIVHCTMILSCCLLGSLVSGEWTRTGNVSDATVIEFVVGLKIDFDHGDFVKAHEDSREWKSFEEVRGNAVKRIGHCNTTVKELKGFQVVQESHFGEYLTIKTEIGDLKELFKANSLDFGEYRFGNTNETIIRAETQGKKGILSLVKNETIKDCIGFIGRISDKPFVRNGVQARFLSTDRINPATLQSMYSTPDLSSETNQETVMGVVEFATASTQSGDVIQSMVSPDDLATFQKTFSLPSNPISEFFPLGVEPTGSCIASQGCTEPNLDVQYLSAMNNAAIYYYNIKDYSELLQMIASNSKKPVVLSISYGSPEASDSGLEQICIEFANLAYQGTTTFAAAGDQGATNGNPECSYTPSFPASCPYVTAVGATTGYSKNTEVVAQGNENSGITSGGGFSTIFTSANGFDLSFQGSNVAHYLQNYADSSASGYANGRGYPDIAAAGTNFEVVSGETMEGVDGTSAATPTMASMVAIAAQSNGGKGFGWINPLLYKASAGTFWDVTSGQNDCTLSSGSCCTTTGGIVGFKASPGWDPASGMGTLGVDHGFANLEALLLKRSDTNTTFSPTTAPTYAPTNNGSRTVSTFLPFVLAIAGLMRTL